jgi:DNA polymerase V
MDFTVVAAALSASKQPFTPLLHTESTPDPIDLNMLVIHPGETVLVRHMGLSMINAFIPNDALLLVDRSITPENNSIVLASVNGTLMVRYLKKNDYKRKLVPANPKYPETEIVAGMPFAILGVVTQVISDPGKLKNVC